MRLGIMALVAAVILFVPSRHAWAEEAGTAQVDELRQRIAELEKRLRVYEEQLEGTAEPINLGRTSLAAVSASSVNGTRSLANGYYGVRNAFDDGSNWINKINYTYWLGGGEASPWIDVAFDVPVTVTRIVVESGPAYTARLFMNKGGEVDFACNQGTATPPSPVHGVSRVRLAFQRQPRTQVNEVRVLGYVPPGVDYTVCTPRIPFTHDTAFTIAQEAFTNWRQALFVGVGPFIKETPEHYVVTHCLNGMPVFRSTIDKQTSEIESEALVKLAPIEPGDEAVSVKGRDGDQAPALAVQPPPRCPPMVPRK